MFNELYDTHIMNIIQSSVYRRFCFLTSCIKIYDHLTNIVDINFVPVADN